MPTRRIRLLPEDALSCESLEEALRGALAKRLPGVPVIRCSGTYSDDWCLSADLTEDQVDRWRLAVANFIVVGMVEDDL